MEALEIPKGLCQCGCGEKTLLAYRNHKRRGWIKGEPVQFIHGHNAKGNNNSQWNGGRSVTKRGYVMIHQPNYYRADSKGYVPEHIWLAEKALGKPLPPKAIVHHHTPKQLIICQDNAYHRLLHQRQRAYEACGNANWRKCKFCKKYDDPKNLIIRISPSRIYHQSCNTEYYQERRHRD